MTTTNSTDQNITPDKSSAKQAKQILQLLKNWEKLREKVKQSTQNENIQNLYKKFQMLEWKNRVWTIIIAIAVLLFFLGPYSLLFHESNTLLAESEKRGYTLAQLLAASNQNAMSQDKTVLYSINSVQQELGVKNAWITDTSGMILSPVERFGKTLSKNEIFSSPSGCEKRQQGYDYTFVCPITKWLETESGFQTQVMGYAYLVYSSQDSLNFLSNRSVELFKYFIWFSLFFLSLGYVIIKITQIDLTNVKFDLRSVNRGATTNFAIPENFSDLQELALEIQELQKNQSSPGIQGASHVSSETLFSQFENILNEPFLIIDPYKAVAYTSNKTKNLYEISENTHILRAFQKTKINDSLLKAFSNFIDSNENSTTQKIDGEKEIQLSRFSSDGSEHFIVIFKEGTPA